MDQETAPTARKNWNKLSAEHQSEINELLADLQPVIDMMNLNIAKLVSAGDDAKLDDYCALATSYLNEKWAPYSGDVFLISGQMYLPETRVTPNSINCQPEKYSHLTTAYSQDFKVSPVGENARDADISELKIVMVFAQPLNGEVDTPWLYARFQPRIFAELKEVSLQYLRPQSKEAVSSDIGEVTDSIARVDAVLQEHLKNPESDFYKISGKEQEAFIRSAVDSVNDVLPSPETDDFVKINNAQTAELVIIDFEEGRPAAKFTSSSKPITINGCVRGVTVIELLNMKQKKIKSPDNLDENSFGLSLIVSPSSISHKIEGYQDEDILIPLSQLKSVNFELV